MACPFPRSRTDTTGAKSHLKRALTTRQGSVQIALEEEEEVKNTLNLKHLNSAILVLTNPPNEIVQEAVKCLTQKEDKYDCLKKLPHDVSSCKHYAYLEDIYDILRWDKDTDETDEFFDKLGQELINTCCSNPLERAFKCLGGDLKEFLTTLDGVHDVLKYQQNTSDGDHPETEAAFVCNAVDDFNLHLDFTTERPPVAYLLAGSLKALAKKLYSTEVEITMTQNFDDKRHFR